MLTKEMAGVFFSMTRTNEEVNAEILQRRTELLHRNTNPHVGDFVVFKDCQRRISYIWTWNENGEQPVENWGIQTSDGGSFYLGEGYISFSGGLYPGFRGSLLKPTNVMRQGWIWFFNRDWPGAGRGVHFQIPFRVWTVNRNADEVYRT